MAFLSTSPRFGPGVLRFARLDPDPLTYSPSDDAVRPYNRRLSSRLGTFGATRSADPQPAPSLVQDAARDVRQQSPLSLTPSPSHYTPQLDGQFERVLTRDDLRVKAKRRVQASRRAATAAAARERLGPRPEIPQLRPLGPGSYDVDKDRHPETIAVPCSFGRERRRGILDCVLGQRDRPERRYSPTASSSASDVPRGVERRLLRLARSQQAQRRHSEEATASTTTSSPPKALAQSIDALGRTLERLELRVLSSAGSQRSRFPPDSSADSVATRLGPGTYFASGATAESLDSARLAELSPTLPLTDAQRSELSELLSAAAETPETAWRRRRRSTFGATKRPDLLVSLRRAGHVSCTADDAEIAPGMYELPSALTPPSHNVRFRGRASKRHSQSDASRAERDPERASREERQDDDRRHEERLD
ncbi:hypothetical protein P43SY_009060 [Pythium insidiosum]|uniref:Uncharacterized protein n=1 Tax=Pythium insidiosum TaxID=114742 RepID=A0AAD5QE12_PYTIN|nr:hypothetical protein P43SY_009060 [Pythium insidiosum]